ncbi:MAG: beta-glucanase [Candidatus Saccharibacteria bacterium]|nr:beta-glucanase [Candidatus Saccharibacteria bacterium]
MFNFEYIATLNPIYAILVGVIYVAIMRSLYANNFSPVPYAKRLVRSLRYIAKSLKRMCLWIKKSTANSWQFGAGVVFATVLFGAIMYLTGFTLKPTGILSGASSVVNFIATTTTKRTIIDSTKPWVYDFSKQSVGSLDPKIWNIENSSTKADYNNELETFTNRTNNVRVENGTLILEAQKEQKDGKAYTSGRVDTNGSFSFIYGTLEIDAKLPRGVGTWPAAWLMPANPRYNAADFKDATDQTRIWTLNGELDFLESVGYLTGENIPASHSYNSLARTAEYTPGFITNPYDEFHRYGIIKTPNSVEFTIDGVVYARRDKTSDDPLEWPFDQPYYLILNLSIGGVWAGKYGVDDASAPWQYQIKSISYTPLASSN